jgi:hypothetical protein
METSKQPGGTIVRGDDGTIYFIRDEILQLTKVTEPEMAAFCAELLEEHEPETAGFALASGGEITTLAFTGPFQQSAALDPSRVASTIMCPGSMKSGTFESLPAFRSGF